MAEKVRRSKIAWSDDLSYDSEEEKEKERQFNAELAEIEAPEKPSYSEEDLNILIGYVKRMTTLCYLNQDDWNEDCHQIIKDFFLDPKNILLVIYYSERKLKCSLEIPTVSILDLTYFLRKPDAIFTIDHFHNEVTCGTVAGNIEKCLLKTLESVYAPLIFKVKHWPDNIKNDISSELHLFLAKLTDFHYTSRGLTVFYIPREGLERSFDEVCKDNSLVERIEEVVVYWTKQLKTCLEDNKNIPAMKELIRPIDEYEFWVYRNENLTGVQHQLKNQKLSFIQEVLLNNHSSHIVQFQALCDQLNECIYEAQSNINYLQLIIDPCKEMENLKHSEEQSKMFSKILNTFRVVWMTSPFYNTPTKLTDLYSYLSNQIIMQCTRFIDMNTLFTGKTRKAMDEFRQCIKCCMEYKNVYKLISDAHNDADPGSWKLDDKLIFNCLDSFMQRCVDMLEVCNCMIIFGRIDEKEAITTPRLGGTKGREYEKACENIENKFKNALKNIQNASDSMLNVQDTRWYDYMKIFRNTIHEIEVMVENLLDLIFDSVNNVQEAIEALCSMHNYSRRQNLVKVFQDKITRVWEIFSSEITIIKENIISEKYDQPSGIPSFYGRLLNISIQKNYVTFLMEKIKSALWLEPSNKTETVTLLYSNLLSIINNVIGKVWKSFQISANINYEKTMETTLITKHRTNTIDYLTCNINRTLIKILFELFYWQNIGQDMGENLLKLCGKKHESIQTYENVIFLTKSYNSTLYSLSKNERILLGLVISEYYASLEPDIKFLNWNSPAIQKYIDQSLIEYNKMKENIDLFKICNLNITTLILQISKSSLVEDFSTKTFHLQEFINFLTNFWKEKLEQVLMLTKRIVFFLEIIFLEIRPNEKIQESWYFYIRHYDYLIESALSLNLQRSLSCLHNSLIGNALGQNSILRVELALKNDEMIFNPSIAEIQEVFSLILPKLVKYVRTMKKLSNTFNLAGAEHDFYFYNVEYEECVKIHSRIMDEVSRALSNVRKHTKLWDKYRHIWELPKQEFVSIYEKQVPTKSDINKDVSGFKDLQSNVEAQDAKIQIDFIELDSSSLKKSISECCSSWMNDLQNINKQSFSEKEKMRTVYVSLKKTTTETTEKISNNLSELQEHLEIYDRLCVDLYQNEEVRPLAK